ncbi:MAG TPA: tetratricopeptide repeat protein, partial [Terriglobales bacterium]|nr:tetratricopeptide repeat protein [Terriglobales bacterium]
SLNPRDHAVISQLATINLGKGNTAEALKFFNEFLALESRTDELATLANSFEKHGHLETALKAYETLSKSGIQKYHEMGRVYMRLGNYQRAYEKFSEGAKRLPNDLASIYNAGFALKKLGNTEAALGFFAKAIELFEKRDLASTGPALKANYLQSMSHAYAAVGQTAKARAFLEQAISIARTLTKTQIFSSLGYADVSPNHFIQESMHLLKQLRNH